MKPLYSRMCLLLFISALATSLQAQQGWGNLGPLFDLFTEDQESEFQFEFGGLTDSLFSDRNDGLTLDNFDFGLGQDSLSFYLNNGGIGTTDSLNDVWMGNLGSLEDFFSNTNLGEDDSLIVAGNYNNVDSLWNVEFDSINTSILTYQDSLSNLNERIFDGSFIRYDVSQGNLVQNFGLLEGLTMDSLFTPNTNVGVDNIGEASEQSLFSSELDIELAFGQEWSTTRFYNETYETRASAVRLASVPRFDNNFGYRWSMEGSFFTNTENILSETNAVLEEGLNAFVCNADAAVLYTPMLGCFNGIFRLYTSIGMEASAYIPSHRVEEGNPRQQERVGKTTGYGPQLGVGFSVSYDNIAIYSYGTVAQGAVTNSNDYRYNSMFINAGVRMGNAVNVRYSYGEYAWAPDRAKNAKLSRFTVGVILAELNN